MRILFLFQIFDYNRSTIYLDLVRACRDRGHKVTLIAGTSDMSLPDGVVDVEGIKTVYMKLGDQFGANAVKKALIQMSIPGYMKQILKNELENDVFDVIAYPTPPITLAPVLKYLKKRSRSSVKYLMLKDIFPQNAVDLGMFSKKSPIYKYYRRMEKQLYDLSDRIGCMSEANIDYLKTHDPEILNEKIEYFPNTVAIHDINLQSDKKDRDNDKLEIMFGGNMGKPQDIEGLLKMIGACGRNPDLYNVHFYFVGDGSESGKIEEFIERESPDNFSYSHALNREEYEKLLEDADIGMISLSRNFTIPNFPSRILSYMQIGKPVFAVTDEVTDIGECITKEANCGYACIAGDEEEFIRTVKTILEDKDRLLELGQNGRRYLEKYFNVETSVDILERSYRG